MHSHSKIIKRKNEMRIKTDPNEISTKQKESLKIRFCLKKRFQNITLSVNRRKNT